MSDQEKYLTCEEVGLANGFLLSGRDLLTGVCGTCIDAYLMDLWPRNLEVIFHRVAEVYKQNFEEQLPNFYVRHFTDAAELDDFVGQHIMSIPEIIDLNLSQDEVDRGISVNDENRDKYSFVDRYTPIEPANEAFVDLGALQRNIVRAIMQSQVSLSMPSFYRKRFDK